MVRVAAAARPDSFVLHVNVRVRLLLLPRFIVRNGSAVVRKRRRKKVLNGDVSGEAFLRGPTATGFPTKIFGLSFAAMRKIGRRDLAVCVFPFSTPPPNGTFFIEERNRSKIDL